MKKALAYCLILLIMITGAFGTSAAVFADEASDQVASGSEMAKAQPVGEEGMVVVTGDDVKDGTYDITVDSSSAMFKVEACKLTVKKGKMTAVMTMSGTGYTKVFLGTGEEAVAADESEYIPYVETADGRHTYEVPVEALNKVINLTSFSKDREKWYDRQLVFRADSLPEDAVLVDLDGNKLDYKDGEYTVEVDLNGGSGKASVTSPAQMTITDGEAVVRLEWSSSNYDYMVISEKKYFPIAGEDNSVFEIPVHVFDSPVTVIADTTAMSQPHEIEYTLTFYSDTIEATGGISAAVIIGIIIIIVAVIAVALVMRKKKNQNEK